MFVSAREAAAMLAEAGLTRPQARRVLAVGLAGEAVRTRGALLFDAVRVRELVGAPPLTPPAVTLPGGGSPLLVARLGPGRGFHVGLSPDEQRSIASGPWPATALQRLTLRVAVAEQAPGPVPFLATVAGYVVLAAALLGTAVTRTSTGEQTYFELGPAGTWADRVVGLRCRTGPGDSWLWFS